LSLVPFALGLCVSALHAADDARVLPVASCEKLGEREFRVSVTYFNCAGAFDRDYLAFIHFDRDERRERLYMLPAPGPRPLVGSAGTSKWGPNEVTTVEFAPVTIPESMKREVFVKAGLYDADGDGGRLPLVGGDGSRRVLVGRIVPGAKGWEFVRTAPTGPGREAETVGVRPRALVRAMPVRPAVRLGEIDLAKWAVEGTRGGTASAERTREEVCWSEASLKIMYAGEGGHSGFVLRPPAPLPVPADADVARLWLLGRAHGWSKSLTSEQPLLAHYLELRDARGDTHRLGFGRRVSYPFWYVARKRLPSEWTRPLVCTGIGFTGCTNQKPRSLILDALVFARDDLRKTLTTDVRLDDLPFPTDPDGLLPSQLAGPFVNRIERAEHRCDLSYQGKDGRLQYVYRPATGTLDDLEVVWTRAGGTTSRRFKMAAEGGPVVEIGGRAYPPAAPGLRRTCLRFDVSKERVHTRWRCEAAGGSAEYVLDLAVKGKSLLVEVEATDEALVGFTAGQIDGAADARFVDVPYWTWVAWDWGRDGGVAVVDEVFVSGLVDWYRSRASCITFGPPRISHQPEALTGESVAFAPGVRYHTRSDGRRNPLRERFIFTVSPNVHEALPNIPHPRSPNADQLARYVHSTGGQARRLAEQLEGWRELAAYGVNRVYIRHFDGMWADQPQGTQEWTLTEHAAPLVGDVAMREYLDELRELGFLPVLYTNYTDLQPVAAEFDWDKIALRPNGDISDHCWPGSYPLKPLRAVELEAHYAPRIAKRFGTEGSFCDVHTAAAPWGKVDYDARLPGAAQFGTTYRCYAKLLLNERATYGAVYSEGSLHWLYAGLHDGSDGQLRSPHPHREPFLVDFDLLKIHPKQMDAGMSWISRYVESPEDREELGGPEAAQDRFTAATIAFGHQGTFTGYRFRDYRTDIKTYYLIQPLQMRYAMRTAKEIKYRDPDTGQMRTTSDVIRSGAYRHSQVYVRYDGGLAVRVNGSFEKGWPVTVDGETYELPPSGFVCSAPKVLVFSATVQGRRVDYRRTDDVRFIDTRGKRQQWRELDTDGAAILRREANGAWSVWPLGRLSVLRINAGALGLVAPVTVTAHDQEGMATDASQVQATDGFLTVPIEKEAFRYAVVAHLRSSSSN